MTLRFHRPADGATLELRHARGWFLLFGPGYLLWLRLWTEAVLLAVALWGLAHAAAGYTRQVTGAAPFDFETATAALDTVRSAPGRTAAADQAARALIAMSLPIYAGGFALIGSLLALSLLLPRYLRWRYRRRGWLTAPGYPA